MNNYLTQFIPQLGVQDPTDIHDNNNEQECLFPKVRYVSVFNPSQISDKCESNEELIKQILCFVFGENGINDATLDDNEKLKIIGLIRGVNSFLKNFAKGDQCETGVIKTNASLLIVKLFEENYYIVCCISISSLTQKNAKIIEHQMSKLIDQAYNQFTVLNGSFEKVLDEYNLEILKNSLDGFWNEFINSYNSEYLEVPYKQKWTNSLNYKGFLGLLGRDNHLNVYKKSSIIINDSTNDYIDKILYNNSQTTHLQPKGLIISCLNQIEPKKYGLIYSNSSYVKHTNKKLINSQGLINIYNWIEYYDYHHKLDSKNLTSLDYEGFFSSPEIIRQQLNNEQQITSSFISVEDPDSKSVMSTAASTFDMINPINFTNDYIILPFNNTMNNVINLGGFNNDNNIIESNQGSLIQNWLTIPSYLKPFSQGNAQQIKTRLNPSSEPVIDNSSLNEESNNESEGQYIIGLSKDTNSNSIIYKRLVYLNSIVENDDKELKLKEREYLLVVYTMHDVLVTLVYDSSLDELNQETFYTNLSRDTIHPLIEELNTLLLNGSIISHSIGSLPRSLDVLRMNNTKAYGSSGQDTDSQNKFYFIIYDTIEGWVKSSLPYLPILNSALNAKSESDDELNKANIKYKNAMFHLHDQLSDIFIAQKNTDFFSGNNVNEFFHKFSSSKHFDWMFYYIKYNNKFIIIIKSRNRNHRITSKRNIKAVPQKSNNIASSSPISSTTQQNNNIKLHQITDYANLGFLNNLGDDVKLWLESFGLEGEV